MPLKEQLKEEIRTEHRKMKAMSLQDKLWYIWEYYKFHIGGAIVVVMLICTIITSINNATIHPGLHCMIINNQSTEELNAAILEQDFHDLMGFGKKQPIYVESMSIAYGDAATQYSYACMAKLSALAASRDLDILIADRESVEYYGAQGGLADLNQLLPADILAAAEDRLGYAADGIGQSLAVSLDISGTDFARSMHLSENALNLSIISNSTRIDVAIALIQYIFGL